MSDREITVEYVEYLAEMAKLSLTDEEVEEFIEEIELVNEKIDALNELDVADYEPTYHGNNIHSVMRSDEPEEPTNRELLFKNTKQEAADYIEVPAMIDDGEGQA